MDVAPCICTSLEWEDTIQLPAIMKEIDEVIDTSGRPFSLATRVAYLLPDQSFAGIKGIFSLKISAHPVGKAEETSALLNSLPDRLDSTKLWEGKTATLERKTDIVNE